jgi:hypothetical protein
MVLVVALEECSECGDAVSVGGGLSGGGVDNTGGSGTGGGRDERNFEREVYQKLAGARTTTWGRSIDPPSIPRCVVVLL